MLNSKQAKAKIQLLQTLTQSISKTTELNAVLTATLRTVCESINLAMAAAAQVALKNCF